MKIEDFNCVPWTRAPGPMEMGERRWMGGRIHKRFQQGVCAYINVHDSRLESVLILNTLLPFSSR